MSELRVELFGLLLSLLDQFHTADAVAGAESTEAVEIEPPLAVVIDPGALETLFEDTTASELEVQFMYRGHDIILDRDSQVQVN